MVCIENRHMLLMRGLSMRKDSIYIRLLALLAAFASVVSAYAAQDEPLPPREAYRYAVTDTGDALEVDD